MGETVVVQCSRCGVKVPLYDKGDGGGASPDQVSGVPLCTMCLLEDESCGCSDELLAPRRSSAAAPGADAPGAPAPGAAAPGDEK